MAVLSLPLSFNNSFWSQDYRRGLEVLYTKLEQGVAENAEIVNFIRARAHAENQLAASLTNPALTGPKGAGFGADDGASLLMAFRGLQEESATQGKVHKAIANELETLVADPFADWARGYRDRLHQNKGTVMDHWLRAYEHAQGEADKLKHQYLAKTRKADEAEDDLKFAPNAPADTYTTSPNMRPADSHRTPPQRTPSVSERIAARLKEIQKRSAGALAQKEENGNEKATSPSPETSETPTPKVDKGKGRAVEPQSPVLASPTAMSPLAAKLELPPLPSSPMPPMPPPPMLLAGLSLPVSAISQLLTKAAEELPLRPVRVPLLGEYQDCFTGDEFVRWLNDNVDGFGGSFDRAEEAAKDLTEREGLLRRIGEFGNEFESSDDAFYQFRPKAFDLENQHTKEPPTESAPSPTKPNNLFKRANNFAGLVSKALAANAAANNQPAYVRARQEAEEADKDYRVAVRKLDRQRLGLEERIEDTLKTLQRWEIERLRAVKTVLLQYHGTLSNLPKGLEPSLERSATLIAAYQPEQDLTALIERYRTGPFRPDPQVYESVSHDECDVVFGIDLRKWAEGGWDALTTGQEKHDTLPPVFSALLDGVKGAYERAPSDAEKRKAWIYEVPLPAVHFLREALNAIPPEQPIPAELFAQYDAPVVAATIKLWLLELDPPLALYEGWDEVRKLYGTVGAKAEKSEEEHVQELQTALLRLPRVHLYVLDTLVKHLKELIEETEVDESEEVYVTKLALSIGRTIIRPKVETELSIQDRHPTLLFIDLLTKYDSIIPPTIARKKRESTRKVPLRKRTAPVDVRLSRSRISLGADTQQLLAMQQAAKNPPPKPVHDEAPVPEVPPPPPLEKPVEEAPKPPTPPQAAEEESTPRRPAFKEPPPEDDDLPPRPQFRDPPPEPDESSPPMPSRFAEPPPEDSDTPTPGVATSPPSSPPAGQSPSTTVIPPTPQRTPGSPTKRASGVRSPTESLRSASPASPNEDRPLSTGRTSISRQTSAGVRGPRGTRGPRPPSGKVGDMVQNLNKRSSLASSPPRSGSPTSKRFSGGVPGSPTTSSRPNSMLGRSTAFSRRTMASDAEEEIVNN
ncbi:hypothetical protein K525DRAFT_231913 [Schizophyllum commune Loenen D]|nr:hypothetical protein K525DRAFT_231913 [Schizophyllum commune Loenen D]